MCDQFDTMWRAFPDELNSGEYDFKGGSLNIYCSNRKCENDIDKINAGSLWLFKQFYGSSYNFSSNANGNMNIVTYIMTWISYKLNQKPQKEITKFNDFYSKHMENVEEYKKTIDGATGYKNYIDLINQNKLMDIDISVMSKFYDLFKNICSMYINIGKKNKGEMYLEYAKKFANEYKQLFNDNDNNEGNSYNKILSALSSDYYNFEKNKVDGKPINLPSLPTKKTVENVDISNPKETQDVSLSETPASSYEAKVSDSDSTLPSPSQVNKLILIPIIFVATLILLGIAYKYSLFGFRKRSQKQYLREKIKR
ncbi:PIR protein [Plasmodium yoelii yoelii]|uniref:PIR protein n=3 Tax=Plasmodium yoelii TaxID=5861 RepID=A0AAF0B282_PLAYO|nr:PIR protein [Plasmodium yoelii yoelii]